MKANGRIPEQEMLKPTDIPSHILVPLAPVAVGDVVDEYFIQLHNWAVTLTRPFHLEAAVTDGDYIVVNLLIPDHGNKLYHLA